MLSNTDQHFLVQLAGYVMGMAGAGVIVLYLLFRSFKGLEKLLDLFIKFIFSGFAKKKTVE